MSLIHTLCHSVRTIYSFRGTGCFLRLNIVKSSEYVNPSINFNFVSDVFTISRNGLEIKKLMANSASPNPIKHSKMISTGNDVFCCVGSSCINSQCLNWLTPIPL
eukprot:763137_1